MVINIEICLEIQNFRERRVVFQTTTQAPLGPGVKTRSLSGTFATDGSNETNADVMKLITIGLLDGMIIIIF